MSPEAQNAQGPKTDESLGVIVRLECLMNVQIYVKRSRRSVERQICSSPAQEARGDRCGDLKNSK